MQLDGLSNTELHALVTSLQASNALLRDTVEELTASNASFAERLVAAENHSMLERAGFAAERERLETIIRLIKADRERLLRRLFTRSSEKLSPDQIELFRADLLKEAETELDAEQAEKDAARQKDEDDREPAKRNGRRRLPSELRRERREHRLAESERVCSCCNEVMQPFGEEVSEQLEYVPADLFVIENVRIKYACTSCEQGVRTAVSPAQPIEKGLPGPALLAHVALSKYGHHLPLYRLEQIFAEQGCPVSRKTMCDWVEKVAGLLAPIVAEQKRLLLAEPLLQADETPVPYQDPMRKGKLSQGYLWAYTKPWAEVVFDFTPTRSREAPRAFLAGFAGHLQTDGYAGYSSLFEDRVDARIGCLAHVRRKFFEARHETESAGTALPPSSASIASRNVVATKRFVDRSSSLFAKAKSYRFSMSSKRISATSSRGRCRRACSARPWGTQSGSGRRSGATHRLPKPTPTTTRASRPCGCPCSGARTGCLPEVSRADGAVP